MATSDQPTTCFAHTTYNRAWQAAALSPFTVTECSTTPGARRQHDVPRATGRTDPQKTEGARRRTTCYSKTTCSRSRRAKTVLPNTAIQCSTPPRPRHGSSRRPAPSRTAPQKNGGRTTPRNMFRSNDLRPMRVSVGRFAITGAISSRSTMPTPSQTWQPETARNSAFLQPVAAPGSRGLSWTTVRPPLQCLEHCLRIG